MNNSALPYSILGTFDVEKLIYLISSNFGIVYINWNVFCKTTKILDRMQVLRNNWTLEY